MYAQQIYGATAIKSGRVIAWKAIMTVETAGLRGAGTDAKQFAWPYTGSSLLSDLSHPSWVVRISKRRTVPTASVRRTR